MILLAAVITLLWQQQYRQQTQANSAYVVGSPTLPAETVNRILAGTPMAGTGLVIEEASRTTNIDDAFALGVWWTETNDGAAGVGLSYRNPGGVRSSAGYTIGGGGYTIYPSYAAAIDDWFQIVESRYINRGLTSVYTICYPYVGTSGATSWANKVFNLMARYHAMAPAPTPIPTPSPIPSPTPTPKPRDWEQEQVVMIVPPHHAKQFAPVATSAKVPATLPAVGVATAALSSTTENLLIGVGLVGSVMLAGLGLMLRRHTQVSRSPAAPAFPITTALAMNAVNELNGGLPFHANHFLPVSHEYVSSLVPSEFASLHSSAQPATAPLQAVTRSSLLTQQYSGPAMAPRSIPLTPIVTQTELLSTANEEKSPTSLALANNEHPSPTTTEGLPSIRPGISLPARGKDNVLELMAAGRTMGAKPRGLLDRYRDNSTEKQD